MIKTRKVAIVLGITICWMMIFIGIFARPIQHDTNISPAVKSAYLATCKIEVEDANFPGDKDEYFIATGVLLNTGYVITAAHCIDVDDNGSISPNERSPIVTFYGSIASVHAGQTVFCGRKNGFDIAVVQLESPPQSSILLGDVKFGDELFTIGMTRGLTPNISVGRESSSIGGNGRATIAIWSGNSGGGLWNKNQKVVGFVSHIGMARNSASITIPIPQERGMTLVRGTFDTYFPLANWLIYTNAKELKYELDARRLTFIYNAIEPESMLPVYNVYARMTLYILGILLCVSIFRKHLFN